MVFGNYAIYPLFVSMIVIETEFKSYDQENNNRTSDPERKSEHVDDCMGAIFPKAPQVSE